MCGIVGQVNFDRRPAQISTILEMRESIKHRGPDGNGVWLQDFISFGHTRLAILDLSEKASQPMLSQDGRYVLIYNGEIYNSQEIRKKLEHLGYKFHSYSDTEIVLNAIIQWSARAFSMFNGMFALAFYDTKENIFFMARDRYGIKPLYFCRIGETLLFASEIRAFKKHKEFSVNLNEEALIEYLTFQNIVSDNSLTRGINSLPGGSFIRIDLNRREEIKIHTYWDFDFQRSDLNTDENEYVEELTRLLRQGVERTLVSDVEVGAYLSGGLDSGTIVGLAAKISNNMKTFTIGFDMQKTAINELGYDERARARIASHHFRTRHYEKVLQPSSLEQSIDNLLKILEDPRMGQSYPNFYAAELASSHVKVVLSGTGGDELFGGYPWRYFTGQEKMSFQSYVDAYFNHWQRLMDEKTLKKLLAPIQTSFNGISTRNIFRNVFKTHLDRLETSEDFVNHALYFESKTFLQGLLKIEDKISMAHGLETRLPFLDNEIVDFALRCPVRFKINGLHNLPTLDENSPTNKKYSYEKKTNQGKNILRKSMERLLPTEIIEADKQGFAAPDINWLRESNSNFIHKRLFDRNNLLYNFIDYKIAIELIDEHLSGKKNKRLLIWSFLNLDIWMRENLQ